MRCVPPCDACVADVGAEAIQYGHRHALCDTLLPVSSDPKLLIAAFQNYTFSAAGDQPCTGYDRRDWMDMSIGNMARSWGWQTCTEVGQTIILYYSVIIVYYSILNVASIIHI